MTPGAYTAIAFFVLLFVVIVRVIMTAPEGYQDDNGFHYGRSVDEWEDEA